MKGFRANFFLAGFLGFLEFLEILEFLENTWNFILSPGKPGISLKTTWNFVAFPAKIKKIIFFFFFKYLFVSVLDIIIAIQ